MAKPSEEAWARLEAFKALLDDEEREARTRQTELHRENSDKVLEAKGVLLRGALIDDERPALFGRMQVTFVENPARKGHLDLFDVRAGASVNLHQRDEHGASNLGAGGVVTRVRARALTVVFDESPSALDPAGTDLMLGTDTVTLRRMQDALHGLRDVSGHTLALIEILLGDKSPREIHLGTYAPLDVALNADQQQAANKAVGCEDIALIHGPPGTGKTRVLVEVVRQLVQSGERVLCLCASNAATDHLAIGLLDKDASLPLARAGHPARIHPLLEAHSLAGLTDTHERRRLARSLFEEAFKILRAARRRSDRGKDAWRREREARVDAGKLFADARRLERQAVDEVLRTTRILCGTLTGFARDLPSAAEFDVLVVDEASQVLTPALLIALPRVRRVVLAGDHKQLPPTVLSPKAQAGGLGQTAFETLMDADVTEAYSHLLTVQHRMHAQLMAFPSAQSYGGALVAHESVAAHSLDDLGIKDDVMALPERILDVIDTAGAGHEERSPEGTESRDNPGEAQLVARVVAALCDAGLSPEDIGVVSPYAAQCALLGSAMAALCDAGLEIDSVDGFQGREKEVIVFSAVRSNDRSEVGFLRDDRRLNVAITRARRKLVVICDSATVGAAPAWAALLDHAMATEQYRSCFELPVD